MTTNPLEPSVKVEQVNQTNTVVYWTIDNKLNPLQVGTNFTSFFERPYYIANGSNTPQNLTLDFDINLVATISNSGYIFHFKNFASDSNKDCLEYIVLNQPPNQRYSGTANFILNPSDIIIIFINDDNTNNSIIKINITSFGSPQLPSSISIVKKIILYLSISIFIIAMVVAFFILGKRHFHL